MKPRRTYSIWAPFWGSLGGAQTVLAFLCWDKGLTVQAVTSAVGALVAGFFVIANEVPR